MISNIFEIEIDPNLGFFEATLTGRNLPVFEDYMLMPWAPQERRPCHERNRVVRSHHTFHRDEGFEMPRPGVFSIVDAGFPVPHVLEPKIHVARQAGGVQAPVAEVFDQRSTTREARVTILSHKISRIYAGKARPPWSSVCRSASTHRVSPAWTAARTHMPKDTLPPLPLSGLFAVTKPSGPTSMSIINDVKNLINTSPLFVEQEKLAAHKEGKGEKPKRRKWKSNRDMVKIGQGGTLDPLAGESTEPPFRSSFSWSYCR